MLNSVIPYKGEKPYIYASYAHKDKDRVFPIIKGIQEAGYRVWFDEGIDPGTEWNNMIVDRLDNCCCFIAFLSQNYIESEPCIDELYFARNVKNIKSQCLLVYLEEIILPNSMAMRIGNMSTIYYYEYSQQEEFYKKLIQLKGISQCYDGMSQKNDIAYPPYEGNEPYILVSYSQEDNERVLPIIREIQDAGYRVWYCTTDNSSMKYTKLIADHIHDCSFLIFMLSNKYVETQDCGKEIAYAVRLKKEMVSVYLEEGIKMSTSMELELDRLYSLYLYTYDSVCLFCEQLFKIKGIDKCHSAKTGEREEKGKEEEEKEEEKSGIYSPYEGNEPYIFVSYAHRDINKALSIIKEIQKAGYRVWYDEGVDPGTEWPKTIVDHMDGCSYFIALLSNNYLNSNNCKKELFYAGKYDKERLPVYIEGEIELPHEIDYDIGMLQSMYYYTYDEPQKFFKKLFQTKKFSCCNRGGENNG